MKKLIFIISVTILNLFSCNSLAQQITDTIFLVKEKNDSDVHEIFIEPYKSSKNYKSIISFSSFPKTSDKNRIIYKNLPQKWIPLYSYKGNYYVYLPCDFSFNQKISLYNKNIFFEDFELYSYHINLYQKIKNKYIIHYNGFEKSKTKLEISIINKEKGIAIFKHIRNSNKIDYKLMVDSNKANLFPLIVNECKYNKTIEFEFDSLDFEKMINQKPY